MIETALIIIALCEIARVAQNAMQLTAIRRDESARNNAYSEFVKSLKNTDREFVERMLKEFQKENE